MANSLNEIRRLFGEGTLTGRSDGQLLERFADRGDGEAFAALVARHGAMVLSVCRSVLGNPDDAEDAFQATFLVLIRKAGSFPLDGSLAGWLYRVARRVAGQARVESERRRARERSAAGRNDVEPPHDPERDEVHRLIHQELARLPERERAPILLCDLQGLTRDDAADALGCPPGTIAGRLARARERLRDRLTRRGVTLSTAWPAGLRVSPEEWSRALDAAARGVVAAANGKPVTAGVAQLAATASRGLLVAKLQAVAILLIAAVGFGAAATALLAFRAESDPPPKPPTARKDAPAAPPHAAFDPDDPETADLFAGRVLDPDGRPLAGARIYLVYVDPSPRQFHVLRDESPATPGAVRAVADADGRFRFSAKDLTFQAIDGLPARRPGLLIASADGYAPDWVQTWGNTGSTFVSHTDPRKTAEWTLTLARDDVPIHGRLLDQDGRPLAGLKVALDALFVPWKKDLDAWLKVTKIMGASLDYDRSLYRPWLLPGLITEAVTDADGRFRLAGLGRERLAQLEIKGPTIADTSLRVMTREAPDFVPNAQLEYQTTLGAGFTYRLPPGRTLTGVVRDRATGEPLPDVWVGFRGAAITGLETGRYSYATDDQGRFSISGISFAYKDKDLKVQAVPKPGRPHFLAEATANEAGEVVIECPRGIPFRLSIKDEAGRPVEAEVNYSMIQPNPLFRRTFPDISLMAGSPLSRAARQADGSYGGVALPGPGAVTVERMRGSGYRPAHVDPKAFFAPGKTDWTVQDLYTTYGTDDALTAETCYGGATLVQLNFAAIVLINPPADSGPLALSATVARDRPRQVTLLDPDGKPVTGASMEWRGATSQPWSNEPRLRASTFPITLLHPDRPRRFTFLKEDRKLIGSLVAQGDGDSPYPLTMRPWATITGRVVDEAGRPLNTANLQGKPPVRAWLEMDTRRQIAAYGDPSLGIFPGTETDAGGRFRVEKLVPGQSYSANLLLGAFGAAKPRGVAFEGLKLAPGEVRDLGDLRANPPVDANAKGAPPQ